MCSENCTLNEDVTKTLHIFGALPIWIESFTDNIRKYRANESFEKKNLRTESRSLLRISQELQPVIFKVVGEFP